MRRSGHRGPTDPAAVATVRFAPLKAGTRRPTSASRGLRTPLRGVMKRVALIIASAIALVLPLLVASGSSAQAATYTKTVRYGPFTIPAGSETDPGMIHNQLRFAVPRPCVDCFITSFTPDLVYADGTRATMATGPMLHHVVFTSQFRSDATCSGTWLGLAGERFFASGNERTKIALPAGYGTAIGSAGTTPGTCWST
jgi:hypothetical protein